MDETSILSAMERLQSPQTRVDLISADGRRFLNPGFNGARTRSDPLTLYPELTDFISSGAESTYIIQVGSCAFKISPLSADASSLQRMTHNTSSGFRDPQVLLSQSDAIFESVLMLGLIAALLAMVMGALQLYRRINRQFRVLTKVAVAYSEGDFSARAPKGMDVESNLLGEALNKLADKIKDQVSEIHMEHNRLRVILGGGMRSGLIAIDDLGKIVLINSVMSRILGFEIREARGRYLSDVVKDSEIIDLLLNTLEYGALWKPKSIWVSDNLKNSLKAYTSPLIDYGQDVSGALIVLHDLTQTRMLKHARGFCRKCLP